MWRKFVPWMLGSLFLVKFLPIECQEDSLRSALKAVNRLEKDLSSENSRWYDDYYLPEEYPSNQVIERRNLERDNFDPLQKGENFNKWGMKKKRLSSSFRERILEENENNQKNNKNYRKDILLLNELRERNIFPEQVNKGDYRDDVDNNNAVDDDGKRDEDEEEDQVSDSPDFLREILIDSFNRENTYPPHVYYSNGRYEKRYLPLEYYPNNNHNMKKRFRLKNYTPSYDEFYDRYIENLDDESSQRQLPKTMKEDFSLKRFRLSKRSSPEKKTTKKDLHKTDPKIEKDLNNIFSKSTKGENARNKMKKTKTESSITRNDQTISKTLLDKKNVKGDRYEGDKINKEKTRVISNQEPLHIQKKSINLSDYFGIDKRKSSKSAEDNMENEWMLERYHKAVALATKRNYLKDFDFDFNLDKVDKDLKDLVETFIDESVKYTGAHEGVTDSTEVRALKDKIIDQLATAYYLERLRNLLIESEDDEGEKKETSPTVNTNKRETNHNDDIVLKKTKINNCNENEKNTKNIKGSSCTKIENVCKNQAADFLGVYNHLLNAACIYHQTCLLCNYNTWLSPPRNCNQMFLEKVNHLCQDDFVCKKVAKESVSHLLNINKYIKMDSGEECIKYCLENSNKP